jgi:hypothetical protein
MGWWAYTSMAPAEPFNGNGTIVILTFEVIGKGSTKITFTNTMLSDKEGVPISHIKKDCFFTNYVPPPATVSVKPQRIVDPTIGPSNSILINITAQNVYKLYSFEFWMNFNNSILEAKNLTVNKNFTEIVKEIKNSQIHISAKLTGQQSITGNLTLVTIEFHVVGVGSSLLDLFNVQLKDEFGQVIQLNEPVDGYFNNILTAIMAVDPESLVDPSLTPSKSFTINITLQNAFNIYGYTFNLLYDTKVLTCIGVSVETLDNETHRYIDITVKDSKGLISVSVQYYYPANPISISTKKTITILKFIVDSYGMSNLHLFNTSVVDPDGNGIYHETKDGFFATLIRDVAILEVFIVSSNVVYPGRNIIIDVVTANRGNMTTETFNVTLYYGDTLIGAQTVTLDPWTSIRLTFIWNTTGVPVFSNNTIIARASLVPYDINPGNNVFSDGWVKIKMLGDINGDDRIDILDISMACSAYGAREGSENWNSEVDLAAPHGIIDIFDIVTIAAKYGTSKV